MKRLIYFFFLMCIGFTASAQRSLVLMRTKEPVIGTVLLLPGTPYKPDKKAAFGVRDALALNKAGYDVAISDYSFTKEAGAEVLRERVLRSVLHDYRLLHESRDKHHTRGAVLNIKGIGTGGYLAACLVAELTEAEQPDHLELISPAYMDEKIKGTVFPAVMPPLRSKTKLTITFTQTDPESWVKRGAEYEKTWKGYEALSAVNPAAVAVEGYSRGRHDEKVAAAAKARYDLVMLGNSITNNFEKSEYKGVWDQFFRPRNALNLGFSGYRTENLIWNIENGELEGQSPKVLVLEIGTNNIDEKNYPTRHTAAQLAGGIEAIVKLVRKKLPQTKIIILRCFPGAYGGPNPTSHRAILERASDIAAKLADGKDIFYCDVNHVFINFDGSIDKDMMPDYLHPSPAGARRWAQAMEPLLSSLMGDQSRDTSKESNTAVVPVSKLENDSYNWWNRHAEVLRIKEAIDPEIVLIGNSITHFWGGLPKLVHADGSPREPNGAKSWASVFGGRRVLNLGFGWDRTQNALWRLDHGELDGLHPKTVIVDIGTNNTSETTNARMNTAEEIVQGIREVCVRVRSKVPGAKIVLMAIFPREKDPQHPRRLLINEVNKRLKIFSEEHQLTLIDIGPEMLAADGTFLPGIMLDFTHPTDKGYQIWADSIKKIVPDLNKR